VPTNTVTFAVGISDKIVIFQSDGNKMWVGYYIEYLAGFCHFSKYLHQKWWRNW